MMKISWELVGHSIWLFGSLVSRSMYPRSLSFSSPPGVSPFRQITVTLTKHLDWHWQFRIILALSVSDVGASFGIFESKIWIPNLASVSRVQCCCVTVRFSAIHSAEHLQCRSQTVCLPNAEMISVYSISSSTRTAC